MEVEAKEFPLKITFIIPAYNAEKTIEKCVNSVKNITEIEKEIIIIDDGSTDKTGEVVKKMLEYNRDIIYIYQQNQGVSVARNNGICKARSEYIFFLDSDDEIIADNFEIICELSKIKPDIIMAGIEVDNGGVCYRIDPPAIDENIRDELISRMTEYPYNKQCKKRHIGGKIYQYLFSTQLLRENTITFNEKLPYGEDLDFCIQAIMHASRVEIVNRPIYKYYVLQGSASHRIRNDFWHELNELYESLQSRIDDYDLTKENKFYFVHAALWHFLSAEGQSYNKNVQEILNYASKEMNEFSSAGCFNKLGPIEKIELFQFRRKKTSLLRMKIKIFQLKKKVRKYI